MRKFNLELKHIILSNGGSATVNGRNYHFLNTCSIDYFLLAVYLICSSSKKIYERSHSNQPTSRLYKTFLAIKEHLMTNKWNLARLEWAKFSRMKCIINQDNSITFDYFLTTGEAFADKISEFQ